jgi:nucleoside-diphosphate-sugar epimerase
MTPTNDCAANPLAIDLDQVLADTRALWDELRGQRIYITGGTGFFGCWLLESFAWANDKLSLHATAFVLTRDPATFRLKAPHLANHPAIQLHIGDVRTFEFPAGSFSHIIHGAAEARADSMSAPDLQLTLDTIIEGTRHTLEFARQCQAKKFLMISSGAVYGRQPPDLTYLPEEYAGAPDPLDPRSAYGEGKRAAELLCALYSKQYGLQTKIARCFAFVGPYLSRVAGFAIGDFIQAGLAGTPIQVRGDGTAYRSYLYAADLATWLWTILFRGKPCQPYNVGSDRQVMIRDLANLVSSSCGSTSTVQIAQQATLHRLHERYVPSVRRAVSELNLKQTVDLTVAIQKSFAYLRRVERAVLGTNGILEKQP